MKKAALILASILVFQTARCFAEDLTLTSRNVSLSGSYKGLTVTETTTDALTLKEGFLAMNDLSGSSGYFRSSGGMVHLGTSTNSSLNFRQNGTDRLVIDENGNLIVNGSSYAPPLASNGSPQTEAYYDERTTPKLHVIAGASNRPYDTFSVNNDPNAGMELRSSSTNGMPYIDFTRNDAADFDARIALTGINELSVQGSYLSLGLGTPEAPLQIFKSAGRRQLIAGGYGEYLGQAASALGPPGNGDMSSNASGAAMLGYNGFLNSDTTSVQYAISGSDLAVMAANYPAEGQFSFLRAPGPSTANAAVSPRILALFTTFNSGGRVVVGDVSAQAQSYLNTSELVLNSDTRGAGLMVTGQGDGNETWSALQMDDDTPSTAANRWVLSHKKRVGLPEAGEFQINYYVTDTSAPRIFSLDRLGRVGIGPTIDPSTITLSTGGPNPTFYNPVLAVQGNARKSAGGNTWAAPSDVRLKHDVQTLSGSLERLLQLHGVTYKWNEPEKHGGETGTLIGFIAQDVEGVFPEWVSTDSGGMKSLALKGFEGLAVEAVKELNSRHEELAEKNRLLRARLTALEERVATLEDTATSR